MRIVAGTLGGRQFDAPRTSRTHPMSERMRGALFNTLGDIDGLTVLDCFGGSGALSYEALSRGARSALIIEIDKTAHKTIIDNIDKLGLKKAARAVRANASSWSDNNTDKEFDIVLCDPPFDGLKLALIEKLFRHVKTGGLLVLSWPTIHSAPGLPSPAIDKFKEKDYGDAQLVFYRKTE